MLTTKEVAERIGVKYPTVMLWLRENKLSGAVKETTPRGDYWLIPESSLVGIVKRGQGRPKKAVSDEESSDQIPNEQPPPIPKSKKGVKKKRQKPKAETEPKRD